MTKKTKSEKQVFCLENMPIIKSKKNSVSFAHNPSPFFRSHEKVATAFLQNLEENDAEAFLEILDTYLEVNKEISLS